MGKKAPDAPDYGAAAAEQARSSREVTEQQTWANRPDQYTPFGSTTWQNRQEWDPSTNQYINRWTQNTNLTPEAQAALDAQMGLQQGRSELAGSLLGRAQQEYGDTMDWSKFTQMGGIPQAHDYTPEELQRTLSTEGLPGLDSSQKYNQQAGDAIYGQWAQRADPEFQRQKAGLQSDLYNKGLREGDPAYDREMEKLSQQQGDARQAAAYQATIGSGAEAQRMLGMDAATRAQLFGERSTAGTFANQAAAQALAQRLQAGGASFNEAMQQSNMMTTQRQQQIAEEMQRRGFSLNEINAIITGQQVGMPSMPGFQNAQRSEGMQSLAAAQMTGQSQLDAFNAEQAGMNAAIGGLSAGAGAAMKFSDRRLKKNVVQWAYLPVLGLWEYFYNYIWEQDTDPLHAGFMADEVEKLYPQAIVIGPLGYKMVNYQVFYGY